MHAIEFQTTINQGMIKVPEQYLHQLSKHAKVIVLMEEEPSPPKGVLAQLLERPLKRRHFKPLRREEIYERQ